jgi:hypothetical protein
MLCYKLTVLKLLKIISFFLIVNHKYTMQLQWKTSCRFRTIDNSVDEKCLCNLLKCLNNFWRP